MSTERDETHDPLGVERDRSKEHDELSDEGPPVAGMATTYGSSFVDSEEHADRIATEPSAPAGPPLGDDGNPGGASNAAPVERPPQQTINRSGES